MMYDGNLEAEAAIVKIALCRKYQEMYSTLEEAGERAGLFPDQIEEVKEMQFLHVTILRMPPVFVPRTLPCPSVSLYRILS